jgi:hypothetical protein
MLIVVMSTADMPVEPPRTGAASVVAGSGVSAIGGAKDSRGSAWSVPQWPRGGAAGDSEGSPGGSWPGGGTHGFK